MLIRALEAWVRIDAPAPVLVLLREAFADLAAPEHRSMDVAEIVWSPTDDGQWQVSLGEASLVLTDVGVALSETIGQINRLAAASVAAEHTVLHAAVFEVDGNAIAVTGASGAGKSTLAAAAVLGGHGYVADEVCAVDPSSRMVRPYHRPVGLRLAGADAIEVTVPADPLDAFRDVFPWRVGEHARLAGPSELSVVAFVDRRPGAVEIVPVSQAEALVRLTTLSLGADGVEREMFRRLDRLVREVQLVTVSFEDSAEAAEVLAELVR